MDTCDLLKALYPPVSYDVNAPHVDASINADAAVLDAVGALIDGIVLEMFPDTCTTTLEDWERVYGLPDKCLEKLNPTTAMRRAFLLAKYNDKGGIKNEDYIARVKFLLGIDVTISEYTPATCEDPCDVPVFGDEWRYVWQVNSEETAAIWYASCIDTCEDPLDFYDNSVLECVIKTHEPAGTFPLFAYGVIDGTD